MATKSSVDVSRTLHDEQYASKLTSEQWDELARNPMLLDITSDEPELLAALNAKMGKTTPAGNGSPNPTLAVGDFAVLGKDTARVHGIGVVGGTGRYMEHMAVPNMVHMKLLRSPHPHAKVVKIDASKAEKFPGVIAVIHRGNAPKEYLDSNTSGGPPALLIFPEEVYQVGTPIAIVVAAEDHIADQAMHMIEVQYQVLPAVTDFLEAMRPTTAKQWDNKLDGTILAKPTPFVRGDGDKGLTQADVVVESTTYHPYYQHVALEPSCAISWWENNALVHYRTSRHAHADRRQLAQILKVTERAVRVITPGYMGSSYGNLRSIGAEEALNAVAAKIVERPVRYWATREEDFVYRTGRGEEQTTAKLGVKRDGTIVAATMNTIGNAGALRSGVATGGWVGPQTLYNIPHMKLEGTDVLTNFFRNGTLRCVSHPNGTLAMEMAMERAAYAIGMNPLDFRLKNVNTVGNPDNKRPYSNPGNRDVLTQAAEKIGWKEKWHAPKAKEVRPGVFHGVAINAHSCSHGAGGEPSTATVIVDTAGNVNVVSAAAEVGAGQRTILAMIAAEAIGVSLDKVAISASVDTDVTTDTGNTAGSRQTNSAGWGAYQAGMDARKQILEGAVKKFIADAARATPPQRITVTADELDIKAGVVSYKNDANKKMNIGDAVAALVPGTPVIGRGAHLHDPKWERLAWAAHAAEIEVDTVTGTIKVLKYVAAHDVGRALNPISVVQQIEGGAIMGLGQALTEELLVDKATGIPVNSNILDYKILSIKDVPKVIDVIMVEKPKEYGVYGAHGVGEPPMALGMSVISCAVYNAIGVWIESMPISRDKILNGLKKV